MKKTILTAATLLSLCSVSAPAIAADLGGGLTANGGVSLVSDYRFRGISQTDKRFAVQSSFTLGHSSGLYGTVWGSSIADYVYYGSDQEIDFTLGYKKTFGSTTVDGGVLYYYYPGSGGFNSDFFEPYLSISQAFGPVTAKVTANYAPKQAALTTGFGKEDNFYLGGDLSTTIPNTSLSVAGHIGHSFGPSYLTFGTDFTKGYTDWSVGASYAIKNLTFGLQYVDTDGAFITPSGRNASKAGIVGSVGVSF